MCAGTAGLVATHGIAPGILTGDGPFLGCFRTAGTACTAARFCAWSGVVWCDVVWLGVV